MKLWGFVLASGLVEGSDRELLVPWSVEEGALA